MDQVPLHKHVYIANIAFAAVAAASATQYVAHKAAR